VTVAACGLEAMAAVSNPANTFDLVLSDIKMPDKSGYDVFASAHARNPDLPVILMTSFGYDPNHSIVRASQEGLQAVIFKPFRVAQMIAEVRKALEARRPAAQA
jgi:DNA-binding NtrC family response regulator